MLLRLITLMFGEAPASLVSRIQAIGDEETLAQVAGFSVSHLHRVFTAAMGESIAAYVRRVRLERAARKLRMGAIDIGEVALAAGYETHAAFGKAFKQRYGLSPSAFRQLGCRAATQLLKERGRKDQRV
jgi:AraC family transcriptional regulator